jgi:hypothetical protein
MHRHRFFEIGYPYSKQYAQRTKRFPTERFFCLFELLDPLFAHSLLFPVDQAADVVGVPHKQTTESAPASTTSGTSFSRKISAATKKQQHRGKRHDRHLLLIRRIAPPMAMAPSAPSGNVMMAML